MATVYVLIADREILHLGTERGEELLHTVPGDAVACGVRKGSWAVLLGAIMQQDGSE